MIKTIGRVLIQLLIQVGIVQLLLKLEWQGLENHKLYLGLLGMTILTVVVNLREGIYLNKTRTFWQYLYHHYIAWIELCGITVLLMYFFREIQDIVPVAVTYTLYFIIQLILFSILKLIFGSFFEKKILIIGVGDVAKKLGTYLERDKFLNIDVVGYLKPNKTNEEKVEVDSKKIIGKFKDLTKYLQDKKIYKVVIATPTLEGDELKKIIGTINYNGKKASLIPNCSDIFTIRIDTKNLDGMLMLTSNVGEISLFQKFVKRTIDIVGGCFGLLIFGLIYLVFGRKIKKDGGPVMYTQERIGKDLKPFKIYKFRSMYADADKRLEELLKDEKIREEYYRTFKLKDDPRITKVGNFLRKTSLDEFPQFINVIKGEMSLVGPRPIVAKELRDYYKEVFGRHVFKFKPGLTGMWQSHGRSNVDDYKERIELDLFYTRNYSIRLELIILVKTVINILKGKDAY